MKRHKNGFNVIHHVTFYCSREYVTCKVKVIAVDISQPVVTKLLDRGTSQAVGIVTDVGAFLPIVEYLEQLTTEE